MNRPRAEERKIDNYRTVTEIVDADSCYEKEFDVTDLAYQNEAHLRKMNKREMFLMVAKYIATIKDLNMPDLRTLFSSSSMVVEMFTLVYYSLAFVNNQMVPHQIKFVDMRFVEVKERKMAIPTEPIVFYKSINSEDQTITCYVDRPGILRILEKTVDVDLKFEMDDNKKDMFKLIDKIRNVEKKQTQMYCMNRLTYADNEQIPKMDEAYVTQFVTLLILFSNAYLGLFKLIRSDFQQYFQYLLNHESLVNEQSLANITNLILGNFSFKVSANGDKKTAGGLVFK
ncbi:odv-ec27 [Matsumuraeses phaseoli granulovirus]|uniref:Odv-ec27 n=1 Tax=Matsumuraeses phaseoli granulovirus TaxID=2760664 RepID=A0AAE7MLF9_9BBAC|nr:odv-ec27 [Matsumuraeses phaseoli granulovirus]QOD40051.1 odv-ec27 [Matsumuraeses phaseoli granulovirus]